MPTKGDTVEGRCYGFLQLLDERRGWVKPFSDGVKMACGSQ